MHRPAHARRPATGCVRLGRANGPEALQPRQSPETDGQSAIPMHPPHPVHPPVQIPHAYSMRPPALFASGGGHGWPPRRCNLAAPQARPPHPLEKAARPGPRPWRRSPATRIGWADQDRSRLVRAHCATALQTSCGRYGFALAARPSTTPHAGRAGFAAGQRLARRSDRG